VLLIHQLKKVTKKDMSVRKVVPTLTSNEH
jgi:hypothetical protein